MKFNSDLKFWLTGLIGGAITLFLPVLLWNAWCLDYIDKHGKFWPWVLAPVFAAISAGIFVGFAYVKKPTTGNGIDGNQLNPFWGWAAVALAIEIFIAAASNT